MAVTRRMTWSAAAGVLVALLVAPALGCAPVTSGTAPLTTGAAPPTGGAAPLTSGAAPLTTGAAALTRGDLRWLARVTFGVDSATVAAYQRLGREKFLDQQLRPPSGDSGGLANAVAALSVARQSAEAQVRASRDEQQRINKLPNEEAKQQARQAVNQAGNQAIYETSKRHLMRALQSPSQLREQMTWFWMNHFTVFSGKANIKWTLAEYEDQTVRPRALGTFRELALAP